MFSTLEVMLCAFLILQTSSCLVISTTCAVLDKCIRHVLQGLLAREVQQYHTDYILNGTAFGELNHPSAASHQTIDSSNVSHQVRACRFAGCSA